MPVTRRRTIELASLAAAATAAAKGRDFGAHAFTSARQAYEKLGWNVRVYSTDANFRDVQARVFQLVDTAKIRDLTVEAARSTEPEATRVIAGAGGVHIHLGGHRVRVAFGVKDGEGKGTQLAAQPMLGPDEERGYRPTPTATVFHCRSVEAKLAVVEMIDEVSESRRRRENPPKFKMMSRWGGWDDHTNVMHRGVDQVILRRGQMDRIVDDMTGFLAAESFYRSRGIPWHRGYLFDGGPGTGKTSLVQALATHFGLDLWYMPLSDVEGDSTILQSLSHIHDQGVLLIEDIDVFDAANSRDDDVELPSGQTIELLKSKLTLSGVLNAFDGIATPPGLIVMMTTNHKERLDPALIRPGRVDMAETLLPVDGDQIADLYHWFYGVHPTIELGEPIQYHAPSDVVEVMKAHMHKPEDGLAAILAEFYRAGATLPA